jgi:hypothetical protein
VFDPGRSPGRVAWLDEPARAFDRRLGSSYAM